MIEKPVVFSEEEILSMYRIIGKNVKRYREKIGMSQLQLSFAMGYKSVSLVSAAELAADGKHFNLEHLYKIAKIFEIDMAELLISE